MTNQTARRRNPALFPLLAALVVGTLLAALFLVGAPSDKAQAHALTKVTNVASVGGASTTLHVRGDNGTLYTLAAQSSRWAVSSLVLYPNECARINGASPVCAGQWSNRVIALGVNTYNVLRTK